LLKHKKSKKYADSAKSIRFFLFIIENFYTLVPPNYWQIL
jgi:hypothetical protein